jgi:hypothetical protein
MAFVMEELGDVVHGLIADKDRAVASGVRFED